MRFYLQHPQAIKQVQTVPIVSKVCDLHRPRVIDEVHGGRLVPGSRCGCFLSRSATIFWYFSLAFSFPAKAEGTISNEGRFGTPEPI